MQFSKSLPSFSKYFPIEDAVNRNPELKVKIYMFYYITIIMLIKIRPQAHNTPCDIS